MEETNKEMEELKNEFAVDFLGESMRRRRRRNLQEEGHSWGCCMEEVEKVLEELSLKGEFAFGSFWGREESRLIFPTPLDEHQFDYDSFVHCHLIEMLAGSLSC